MHEFIEVKNISKLKGRGAFAKKDIKRNTVVDVANIVPISNKDYKKIRKTVFFNYCYIWEDPKHQPEFTNAISFSISQFINHSYEPNLRYLYDYEHKTIEFKTIKDVQKGEELTVNYNGLVKDASPVWFKIEE